MGVFGSYCCYCNAVKLAPVTSFHLTLCEAPVCQLFILEIAVYIHIVYEINSQWVVTLVHRMTSFIPSDKVSIFSPESWLVEFLVLVNNGGRGFKGLLESKA